MLQLLSGQLPDRVRSDRRHPRAGVRAQRRGGRHLAPGRQDRRRHRAEPPEPAGRVRTGPARAGDAPEPRSASSSTHRHRGQGSALATSRTPGSANTNGINPSTIVLALATVGMLLIALVSIGGFTVLAQRRMRSLGMLESMGATDRNVRLVLEANGVIVGVVGAVLGFVLGLVPGWSTDRTTSRAHTTSSATFALPWNVIVPAMVLAVIATFFAASYPARAITRVPVVSALAGRPAPPRQIHRSLVPGVVALVIGFVLFSLSGASGNGGGVIWLVPGLIALIVGDHPRLAVLPGPAGPGRRQVAHRRPPAPARHGALPGPLRLGPLGHQSRHHDRGHHLRRRRRPLRQRLRLCRTEHGGEHAQRVQPSAGREPALLGRGRTGRRPRRHRHRRASRRRWRPRTPSPRRSARRTWSSSTTRPSACRTPAATGRQWNGPIYVATPALLRAYGINPSSIPSNVDILSSRPGLAGSGVQLTFGGGGKGGRTASRAWASGGNSYNQCTPNQCLAHPVVQEESQLPIGHVVTQHGDHRERAAPAAPHEPEQPRGLDDPGQQRHHVGPAQDAPTRWRPPATSASSPRTTRPHRPRSSTGPPSSASPSRSGSWP